jgi:predicted signal transduction protein with EAL and GGDEF domain
MNKRQEEIQDEIVNRVYKIFDKLEQRIATLEKVLQSHAKCIGEMREENFIPIRKDQIESIEKELNK